MEDLNLSKNDWDSSFDEYRSKSECFKDGEEISLFFIKMIGQKHTILIH